MAVKIRLTRRGRKKLAMYDVIVADARSPRDGKIIEKLGTYNPLTNPASILINEDKTLEWLLKGAQPTDTAKRILSHKGLLLKKHLQVGVLKGAITQEQADGKFADWIQSKEAEIAGNISSIEKKKADEASARLAAEKKINEAKAEALKEKLAALVPKEEVAEAVAEEVASDEKAETPQAEVAPTEEEAKVDETPAEEAKVEEAPAEEPKAEEAKEEAPAEEAKVEEAPAEEPKAEEAKAEPAAEEAKEEAPADEKKEEEK